MGCGASRNAEPASSPACVQGPDQEARGGNDEKAGAEAVVRAVSASAAVCEASHASDAGSCRVRSVTCLCEASHAAVCEASNASDAGTVIAQDEEADAEDVCASRSGGNECGREIVVTEAVATAAQASEAGDGESLMGLREDSARGEDQSPDGLGMTPAMEQDTAENEEVRSRLKLSLKKC